MARPIWEGHLKLSLVSCPVALFTATTRTNDISFHLIHKDTHNRIRMIATDPELGPVDRKDLVKGYEFEKDRYVILTKEEIDEVRIPSTKTIDIERFVDAGEIDRIYWNDPYYLAPERKAGLEAYAVIRTAMERVKKVALGRLVLHGRERIVALEPRGPGMVLTTLRSADEVKADRDFFADLPAAKVDQKMVDIAARIIEQQEAPFDPESFTDRYEDALRDLIARKQKGQKPVSAPAPDEGKVVDLMEALRKSLAGGGDKGARAERFLGRHKSEARDPAPKKKPAAKRATRRKAG